MNPIVILAISIVILVFLLIQFAQRTAVLQKVNKVIYQQAYIYGALLGAFIMTGALIANTQFGSYATDNRTYILFTFIAALVVFWLAGFHAYQTTKNFGAAALAGSLAGIIGAVLAAFSYIVINLVFFNIISQQTEKMLNSAQSGYGSLKAYLLISNLYGMAYLIVIFSIFGALFGTLGGIFAKHFRLKN